MTKVGIDSILSNRDLTFVSELEIKDFQLQIRCEEGKLWKKFGNYIYKFDISDKSNSRVYLLLISRKKGQTFLAIGTPLMLHITRIGKNN